MIRGSKAFTLLEVIVALAMLALIAVPAVGLATMAVGRSRAQLATGSASELKGRIDVALRSGIDGDLFSAGFVTVGSEPSFVASRDLRYIELEDASVDVNNDQHYKVQISIPDGYNYAETDAFRILVYEVTWPYKSNEAGRNQLFFTSVFRR